MFTTAFLEEYGFVFLIQLMKIRSVLSASSEEKERHGFAAQLRAQGLQARSTRAGAIFSSLPERTRRSRLRSSGFPRHEYCGLL